MVFTQIFVEEKTIFKICVAHHPMEFAELWPRTDHRGSAHCYAFQCADFLEVWCDTIGRARGTSAFFVAVFDNLEQPVLLLPLGIERHRGIRVLRFLDGGVCDYNAPVVFEPVRDWRSDDVARLWRELSRVLPPFDVAIFDKMPADICGTINPLVTLGSAPFAESGHSVDITSNPRQSRYKRKSRLQRRRIANLGQVAFTIAATTADRLRIVRAMMRQKSRRCIETGQADELDRAGYKHYYIKMTERFAWPGPLLVCALELDNQILSTFWGLIFNSRLLALVSTFESGPWKRYSPGRLLLEDVLEWSAANGITTFDFGIGDESYKLVYTDRRLMLYQANIPVTTLGKAYQIGRNTKAWRLLRPVAKFAVSNLRRLSRAHLKITER